MSLYYFAVGIVLSWNMTLNETPHADIASYQLFAYQEGTSTPSTTLWKKVGISSQSKKGTFIQRASQSKILVLLISLFLFLTSDNFSLSEYLSLL